MYRIDGCDGAVLQVAGGGGGSDPLCVPVCVCVCVRLEVEEESASVFFCGGLRRRKQSSLRSDVCSSVKETYYSSNRDIAVVKETYSSKRDPLQ